MSGRSGSWTTTRDAVCGISGTGPSAFKWMTGTTHAPPLLGGLPHPEHYVPAGGPDRLCKGESPDVDRFRMSDGRADE